MAILKVVNVKAGRNANLKGIINYVLQPKKTEVQLTYGHCCEVSNALDNFNETKETFGKKKGRQYYHFVQSFPPNENITAKQAHEAAIRFVEECKKFIGFEMIAVTHQDREHLHTHFVMDSVSFVDGHKFHITKKELAQMKELQNQICIEMGYSPAPEKGKEMSCKDRKGISTGNSKLFQLVKKAFVKQKDSYILNCHDAMLNAVKMAKTKEQFIQLMHAQGFETEWKENKKHIVFTDIKLKKSGSKKCKVRLNKLAQYFTDLNDFQSKEELLNGIRKNGTSISRNGIDNNRLVDAGDYKQQSKPGKNSGIIDFSAEYERFSAEIDRRRDISKPEKNTRYSNELAGIQQKANGGIAGKTRNSNEREKTGILQRDSRIQEQHRDSIKKFKTRRWNGNSR